ncbi:hypothetical protein GGR32_001145 [Mesonia hippocampi]|uniref:Uncharacterized protein n=1 Tax=Mesonia hippocampi TaxID=1628250 RepID=A0A840EXS0_9FLAO|nr:hypothetical protein [Mesonia hippocampi]MBB4118854.1 hypothetical protein [Mesonia hippocampi]
MVDVDDITIIYTNPKSPQYQIQTNYFIDRIDGLRDTLVLEITENAINQLIEIQGGSHFIMEEDFIFDIETAAQMNLKEGYTIKKGTYPIQKYENEEINKYYIKL